MTLTTSMLVGCVLQVTLFSVLAGAAYLATRRLAAGVAGALLAGSLALVLGLTLLAGSPWPRWEWRAAAPAEGAVGTATPAVVSPTVESDQTIAKPNPELASPYAAAWEAFTGALTTPPEVASTTANRPLLFWANAFWLLAGVGLVVSAGRLAWGVWQVQKLVRCSQPVTDEEAMTAFANLTGQLSLGGGVTLLECPDLATPATVGWRRPQVLLPTAWTEWSGDELCAALAHELAHVAARDYRDWLVARLAVAVHFYHPLVRWLAGRLQLEQELAADAAAARLVGDRQNYLACLASLALSTPPQRLAGPARTLFPSHSLLMRRVEMLRCNVGPRLGRVSGWLRGAAVGLMAVVALGVAGVRQPAAVAEEKPAERGVISFAEETPDRIPLTVVPADAFYAVSVRPAELLADEACNPLVAEIDRMVGYIGRGSVRDLEEVLFVSSPKQGRIVARVNPTDTNYEIIDVTNMLMRGADGEQKTWVDPETKTTVMEVGNRRWTFVDGETVVVDFYFDADTKRLKPHCSDGKPAWEAMWLRQSEQKVVAAMNPETLRAGMSFSRQLLGGFPMQAMAPAINHTEWVVAGVGLGDDLALNAVAQCDDEEHAGRIAKMLQGLLWMGGGVAQQQANAVLQQMEQLPQEEQDKFRPAAERMFGIASDFFENAELVAKEDAVLLGYRTDDLNAKQAGVITSLLLPPIQAAQAAAKRTQSTNNLKQLALAMHNYHDTYGSFPPAVLYKEGSPHPYSWRVALLPFMEQQRVYEAYNFDEPWDSPANKVLAEVPIPTFQSPFDDPGSNNTSYFVLTGPGTVFDGKEGMRFRDIRDGTSKTLMFVEAKRAVPWTKPEDIPYSADTPLPELGGWMPEGFLTAWCDGSVLFVDKDVDEADLRAAISRDGREVIDFSKWNANIPKSERQ